MLPIDENMPQVRPADALRLRGDDQAGRIVETINFRDGDIIDRDIDNFEIIFVLSGRHRMRRDCSPETVIERRAVFLLPPGCHFYSTIETSAYAIVCRFDRQLNLNLHSLIDIAELDEYPLPETPCIYPLDFNFALTRYVEGLSFFVENGLGSMPLIRAKYTELMYILCGLYPKEQVAPLLRPMLGKDLEFRTFIYNNVNECATVKEMADKCNMCERSFRDKFAKEMGMTAGEFILENKKTRVLDQLLHTDKSIKQISQDLGFTDTAYFTHFCLRYFKKTPARIRE